jgi:SAM-dependent methyltransferase
MNPGPQSEKVTRSPSQESPNGNLRFYDRVAPIYDQLYKEIDAAEAVRQWLILIRRFGPVPLPRQDSRMKLLDLGCGTGRYLQPWLDAGFFVTGVDSSRKMLRRATARKAESSNPSRVSLFRHDLRSPSTSLLKFSPFDIAVAHFNFLNLFPLREVQSILGELRHYLLPGGRFFTDCAPPSLLPAAGQETWMIGQRMKIELQTVPDARNRSVAQNYRWGPTEDQERYWFHTSSELNRTARLSGWMVELECGWRPERRSNPWAKKLDQLSHRVCVFKAM